MNCFSSSGNILALCLLIRRGADIDMKDSPWNDTPLSNAIRDGDIELVKFLISQGADVNAPIGRGTENIPLLLTCEFRSLKMVNVLIDNGANTNLLSIEVRGTLLQATCQNGAAAQPDLLSRILDNNFVDTKATSRLWGGNLTTACLIANGVARPVVDPFAFTSNYKLTKFQNYDSIICINCNNQLFCLTLQARLFPVPVLNNHCSNLFKVSLISIPKRNLRP